MLLLEVNKEKDPEISAELQCPLPKDVNNILRLQSSRNITPKQQQQQYKVDLKVMRKILTKAKPTRLSTSTTSSNGLEKSHWKILWEYQPSIMAQPNTSRLDSRLH